MLRRVDADLVIAVDAVDGIDPDEITDEETVRAGFTDRNLLISYLTERDEGAYYRAGLRLDGADPRIELRNNVELDSVGIETIVKKLDRLDFASSYGPWTRVTLRIIAERPATRVPDLAAYFGRETQPFKRHSRKLKELGLTESLEVGYRISPREQLVLDSL